MPAFPAPFPVGAGLTPALVILMVLAPLFASTTTTQSTNHGDDVAIHLETDAANLALLDVGPFSEPKSAATSPPIFRPFTHLATLPPESIPTRTNGRRLIVVGDVHGMRSALEALLESVAFDGGANDRVILAGDLVNKGPDSTGVVDFAIDIGALAVRGNHEDKVLRKVGRDAIGKKQKHTDGKRKHVVGVDDDDGDAVLVTEAGLEPSEKKHKHKHNKDGLGRKRLRWIADLPLILCIGEVEGMGDVVVVHAGLVPGVRLEKQDPWAVLNIRSLVKLDKLDEEDDPGIEHDRPSQDFNGRIPADGHNGRSWSSAWNTYQRTLPRRHRTTVLYGHDSKRGRHIRRYTMGLDSGCVGGDQLTAVVIEGAPDGVAHRIVHVECGDIEW